MEQVITGKRRRKVVVNGSPSGLEDVRRKRDSLLKINGKKVNLKHLTDDAHSRAVHVDATKVTPADVPASETSALWIPLNGSERDALSALIPHQIPPHQKNGDHPSASVAIAELNNGDHPSPSVAIAEPITSRAKPTDTLADTSVVHAIRGRIRLRVPTLKTFPGLAEPLQHLLKDQPGVTDVTVNDWCHSVTVTCDPAVWTPTRLCVWLQLLNVAEVASYKSANTSTDQTQAPTDEAGNELWYSSAGICLVFLVEPLVLPLVPLLLLASAMPMLKRAHHSISEDGKLNVDVLDASATSLLVVQGAFPMAIFMVWLINVADWIRDLTMMQSKKAIEEILGYQNIEAWVVRDGQKVRVSVAEVQIGETVVVYPGERVAVDGTVLSGKALVDQACTHRRIAPGREGGGCSRLRRHGGAGRETLYLRRADWKRNRGRSNPAPGGGRAGS